MQCIKFNAHIYSVHRTNPLCTYTNTSFVHYTKTLYTIQIHSALYKYTVHYTNTLYPIQIHSVKSTNTLSTLYKYRSAIHVLNPHLLQTQSDTGNGYYNRRSSATPLAVILAPTRELALQIYDEARKVCHVLHVLNQAWKLLFNFRMLF